jgi:hypothetical protein
MIILCTLSVIGSTLDRQCEATLSYGQYEVWLRGLHLCRALHSKHCGFFVCVILFTYQLAELLVSANISWFVWVPVCSLAWLSQYRLCLWRVWLTWLNVVRTLCWTSVVPGMFKTYDVSETESISFIVFGGGLELRSATAGSFTKTYFGWSISLKNPEQNTPPS